MIRLDGMKESEHHGRLIDVLLVEDDAADEHALLREVEARRLPYKIVVARDLAAARASLAVRHFDLVLLDHRLPDGTGFDLMDALRGFVVIFTAGHGEEAAAVRAVQMGARDYLIKDAERHHLILLEHRITAVLQQAQHASALRASEDRFALAVRGSSDAIWDLNLLSGQLYVAERWREMLGYEPTEFRGAGVSFFELLHPDDRAGITEAMRAHLKHRQLFTVTFRALARSGQYRWFLARGQAVWNRLEWATRVSGSVTDITDAKRRQHVSGSERRLLELLSRAPRLKEFLDELCIAFEAIWPGAISAVSLVDADGVRTCVGPASQLPPEIVMLMEGTLGAPDAGPYRAPKVLQRPVVVTDLGVEPGWERIAPLAAAHCLAAFWSVPIRSPNAAALGTFSVHFREPRDASIEDLEDLQRGAYLASLAIEHHAAMRQRETLEAQLRQSQKMEAVGLLASGIAHDFNNLLSVIVGTIQMAARGLPADDPLHADLRDVGFAADRASTLVRQLLTFSRQEIVLPTVLDVGALVADVEGMLRRIVREDISLLVEVAPGLPSVFADRGQIEQIIINLAVNARDAMPHGGRLTISIDQALLEASFVAAHDGMTAGPHVRIRISDTGVGMSERVLSRVFEPFFTTKAPGHGTGLGLATVYGIVQQYHGHIEVASTPGAGTEFTVLLPGVAAPQPTVTPPTQQLMRGTETVLIVEDEPALLAICRRMLETAGYTVMSAEGGDAALELLRGYDGPLDLIVSDVVMPGLSGPELALRVKEQRPETRVLLTSGYTGDEELRSDVRLAHVAFIGKPYSLQGLTRRVREVLDG